MKPVAELREARRVYRTAAGPLVAVTSATIAIGPGEILGVAGPSGSGKSTLLRLLAGLERPDHGSLHFAGQPAWPGRARRVRYPRPGYVMPIFQDPFASLDARWPIWRCLTEPLAIAGGADTAQLRASAAGWLARARLDDVDPEARPAELSGGQCQRVAVLRALVAEPALIIADEPVARQDVTTALAIGDLVVEAARGGAAVAVASHDSGWLNYVAHRIIRVEAPAGPSD